MKEKRLLWLVLLSTTAFAQQKSIIKDSITGKAIGFISAWSLEHDCVLTSDKKGKIKIGASLVNDTFLFFSSAYDSKTISGKEIKKEILLKPKKNVEESKIKLKKASEKFIKQDEIDFFGDHPYYSIENNQTQLIAQFIPYQSICDNLKFLSKLIVGAKAESKPGLLKIRFFESDTMENPGLEIVQKELIVKVPQLHFISKDNSQDYFVSLDLKPYQIQFPKIGLFIAFELMNVDENSTSIRLTNGKTIELINPFLLTNDVQDNTVFEFKQGRWNKVIDGTPILMKLSLTN